MTNPHDHRSIVNQLKEEVASIHSTKTPSREKVPTRSVEPMPVEEEPDAFDLEAELASLQASIVAPAKAQPQDPEEILQAKILELLRQHPDAPTDAQIEAWKKKYGQDGVQVISIDSENVYVYTHLSYSQWEAVQKLNRTAQENGNTDIDKAMREAVLRSAILWPRLTPEWFSSCRAGLPTTLFELVMVVSYFMTPQQALTLTTKL